MQVLARAPNHLGDGVMALPALTALAGLGALTIQAPGWGAVLYRDLDARVVERGPAPAGMDVAVLFPPSLRVAWQSRGVPRRIGTPEDYRRWLLTEVVSPAPGHRTETYRRLAEAAGAVVQGGPTWRVRPDDPQVDVPEGHIALFPVSATGSTVDWLRYAELAEALDRPVVAYSGPGQGELVRKRLAGVPLQDALTLPALGRAWERAAVVVSNDTGPAHFARALGRPTVVVHGSTVPERTGALGSIAVQGPDLACRPCYRKRCRHQLECLDIPVTEVLTAIREVADG